MPIDARDNGIRITLVNQFGVIDHRTSNAIYNFNNTSQEDTSLSIKQFEKALGFAKEIIQREIAWSKSMIEGERETEKAIKDQNEPQILILDKNLEWQEAVSKFKNIKFVVYKHRNNKDWCVQSGRDDIENYIDRANLPLEWAGLRNDELEKISGIKGAVFVTNAGWYGSARTKNAALEMAERALHNL